MEEGRAATRPSCRRIDGVVFVARLPRVVALAEAHGAAAADVDRRIEDHATAAAGAQIRAKFASNASPAELDFSGWNWTP